MCSSTRKIWNGGTNPIQRGQTLQPREQCRNPRQHQRLPHIQNPRRRRPFITMRHSSERSVGNAEGRDSASERPDLQHRGCLVPDRAAVAVSDSPSECGANTAIEHSPDTSVLQVTPAIDRLQLCEALCKAAVTTDTATSGPDSAHTWEIILNQEDPPNLFLFEMHQYWKQKFGVPDLHEQRKHLLRPGIDLLEVYCSPDSALTQAADKSGLVASRFGLRQGDLSTFAGRCALYDQLWRKRPKHIWVSPKCGPWCSWSRLNLMKSQELAQPILERTSICGSAQLCAFCSSGVDFLSIST